MESSPILNAQEFWSAYLQPRLIHIQNISSCDPGDIAQVRRTIDDELVVTHRAMCALRTQRNALALISRLPPEVLLRVFLFSTRLSPPLMRPKQPVYWRLGWIGVTHVCKSWREMALGDHHLWADVHHGFNARWLPIVLARSRSAPIYVTLDNIRANIGNWEVISQHALRFVDISLGLHDVGPSSDLTSALMLRPILARPVDALRCLLLRRYGETDVWLPEGIFQDHAPALRVVKLFNIYIRWSSRILCNLTYLKVELNGIEERWIPLLLEDRGSFKASFDQMLGALRRMPALVVLDLTRCISPAFGPSPDAVDLPCLTSLILKDGTKRCATLTSYLRIPPSCNLDISCTGKGEACFVTEVISFFHGHAVRGQTPLQSLEIRDSGPYSVFRISRMAEDDTEAEISYSLELPHPQDLSMSSWDNIACLCHQMPLESVRHLFITAIMQHADWSTQRWIDALGRCSAVEEVQFEGKRDQTLDFCAALAKHVDPEKSVPLFERLSRLTLEGDSLDMVYLDSDSKILFHRALLSEMEARQRIRVIQTVCIGPMIGKDDEWFNKELEKIVPLVEWSSGIDENRDYEGR